MSLFSNSKKSLEHINNFNLSVYYKKEKRKQNFNRTDYQSLKDF